MKRFFKKTCELLGVILSIVFPYRFYYRLFVIYKYLYTSWVSRSFKFVGSNVCIAPSLTLRGGGFVTIGSDSSIGARVTLTAWNKYGSEAFTPQIVIGNNSSIGEDSHVTAINKIIIGNNVRMGKKILITDNAHGASDKKLLEIAPNKRPLYSKGPVIIEDNVWIGEKASIMPGVCIGNGVIIGANSVVTKDIPPNCVVAGNPAKVIKIIR